MVARRFRWHVGNLPRCRREGNEEVGLFLAIELLISDYQEHTDESSKAKMNSKSQGPAFRLTGRGFGLLRGAFQAVAVLSLCAVLKSMASAQPVAAPSTPTDARGGRSAAATGFTSKYRPPAPADILRNRAQATDWADQTRRTIVPTMHLVETAHFLIFSAWNSANDQALAKVCEEMHAMLRRQFNISPSEPIWIGKCPIYVFWDPSHFRRFTTEVDRVSLTKNSAMRSDGYNASRGTLSYIVINGVREFGTTQQEATTRFYEVLAHEGTHAFLNRFISSRSMALWVEEGLADHLAATLVPASGSSRKHVEGARYALRRPSAAARLLDKTELTSMEYGIAQSLVRYLIQRDSRAFIRFVEIMKRGASQDRAMAEAYGFNREEFLDQWAMFSQRSLAGRSP